MNKPLDLYSVPSLDEKTAPLMEDGDVAIILKADGTVKTVSSISAVKELRAQLGGELSPAAQLALEQGRKMLALSTAAKNPRLMALLLEVIDDPTINGALVEQAQANQRH